MTSQLKQRCRMIALLLAMLLSGPAVPTRLMAEAAPPEEPEKGEDDDEEQQRVRQQVQIVIDASESLHFVKPQGGRILRLPEKETKRKAARKE